MTIMHMEAYYMLASKSSRSNFADFVLLRLVCHEGGVLERIGYGHGAKGGLGERDKVKYDVLMASLGEEVKKNLPCIRYEEEWHIICIV